MNNIFAAIAAVFNWLTGRSTVNNAADVRAAQAAQNEVNAKAKTAAAIKERDTNEIRKEWAE